MKVGNEGIAKQALQWIGTKCKSVNVTHRRPMLDDVVTWRRVLVFEGRRVTSLHGD